MSHMDEEQALFEKLNLSDFRVCTTALKAFNNYSIIMTNKVTTYVYHVCDVVIFELILVNFVLLFYIKSHF